MALRVFAIFALGLVLDPVLAAGSATGPGAAEIGSGLVYLLFLIGWTLFVTVLVSTDTDPARLLVRIALYVAGMACMVALVLVPLGLQWLAAHAPEWMAGSASPLIATGVLATLALAWLFAGCFALAAAVQLRAN